MEELDSLESSMVTGICTHPWPQRSHLATWFHSYLLQKIQTFAIAIVRTGCHFNGFFPIAGICPQSWKAKWWKRAKGIKTWCTPHSSAQPLGSDSSWLQWTVSNILPAPWTGFAQLVHNLQIYFPFSLELEAFIPSENEVSVFFKLETEDRDCPIHF